MKESKGNYGELIELQDKLDEEDRERFVSGKLKKYRIYLLVDVNPDCATFGADGIIEGYTIRDAIAKHLELPFNFVNVATSTNGKGDFATIFTEIQEIEYLYFVKEIH